MDRFSAIPLTKHVNKHDQQRPDYVNERSNLDIISNHVGADLLKKAFFDKSAPT
jgi:hypothetical protein